MSRVVVTESIAEAGLRLLREAGHEVVERLDLTPAEVIASVADAEVLIVRSATKITSNVIAAAPKLRVIGRAGVGLDNVDVVAATNSGVIVVNAPSANVISAAEHTMALLLAVARNVPQGHSALLDGRWERELWGGVELHGKTLAIIGLGRIGQLVAQRAQAFEMRLIGYDPFVSPDTAAEFGVLHLGMDELVDQADFLTLHVALTPETLGLIGQEFLARAKPNLRVINVSRGPVIDEVALAEAIRSGVIAGAALDVFENEPCTDSPLFGLPGVVVTPHLGASTEDAQIRVGVTIAEQVNLALADKHADNVINPEASVNRVPRANMRTP